MRITWLFRASCLYSIHDDLFIDNHALVLLLLVLVKPKRIHSLCSLTARKFVAKRRLQGVFNNTKQTYNFCNIGISLKNVVPNTVKNLFHVDIYLQRRQNKC